LWSWLCLSLGCKWEIIIESADYVYLLKENMFEKDFCTVLAETRRGHRIPGTGDRAVVSCLMDVRN